MASAYTYGSFPQMGHPPPKETKKGCQVKSFVLPVFCTLLGVLITAFITWHITKSQYSRNDPHDEIESENVPAAKPEDNISASELRLPTSVSPISYQLTVKTYLPGYGYTADKNNLTFEGQVLIELNITKSIKKVSLNSKDLNYTEEFIKKSSILVNGKSIAFTLDDKQSTHEKIFFNLDETVEPTTSATLKVAFGAPLRTDMSGLYQTTYTNSKGESKMAAVTQMEPVYARRMVPCFDEPAYKATWTVTVIHPNKTVAVSNGIEDKVEDGQPGFIISTFKPTPRMSSYLLAIFISEFEYNEATTKSGVRFRVWSRPEEKNSTMYAVEAGVKCLEYYEKYYNISFPLPKQDMVALPDFSAGAMENWGLITYRESALLYDPRIYSGSQKRRVAVVIAHELAHQWFGNLVTLKWWNDLWLNEGFATLVEYLGTDEISDGNMRMREWFTMDALWSALAADSVASTHPLTFKIDKAMEVLDSFDSVTYDKGGAVLAMVRKTIGEENFNTGINHYLTRHQFDNADAGNLLTALGEKIPDSVMGPKGVKLNISEFMDPWTKQLGYPLLNASRINNTHIIVEQSRFKLLATGKEEEKYSNPVWGFKWDVPVWYQVVGSSELEMKWMKRNEPLIIKSDKNVIINAESNGFYRAGYSSGLWKEISEMLKENHEQFSPQTRVRLIDDSFALARAGLLSYSIPLNLITYLKNEKEYLPWSGAIAKIRELIDMYGSNPEKDIVNKFMIALAENAPARRSIDFVSKNYLDEKKFYEVGAAQQIILNSCGFGDSVCQADMVKMFTEEVLAKCDATRILSECSQIPAPFRAESYCEAVRNGNSDTFEKVFHWYKTERNQVEKLNLMTALTCSKDILTLKKLLLDAMKPEGSSFRLQDCAALFAKISSNDATTDAMLNFLIDRWEDMQKRLATDHSGFSRVLSSIVNTLKTRGGLDQLRKFRKKAPKASEFGLDKMEESAEVTVTWRETNLKFVTKIIEEISKSL
ncbi:Aminopeptidase [Caenorhabditis elegans]|uniref:Aminopeptidase n=2 Tax=Caenorhabditis elegans TaxID=6239 RepID=Q22317_CAEEL|nr:Aminopeptidase [Caenorhabditis elegans]CAB01242.1 Aminopeptidase [Caenorhabditis elegans]|eukprot:NP_001041160.1 Aminopeptidase [Caenorhabditis elegans]